MLTPKRFYFLRAWYEWITDNNLTAHIIVDTQYSGVSVPQDYIENNRITLNISPQAVSGFIMTPQALEFEADFDMPVGIALIVVPIKAIIAIYAQENKQGTFFIEDEEGAQGMMTQSGSLSDKQLPEFTVVEE
jgi:stringent starvation protein B